MSKPGGNTSGLLAVIALLFLGSVLGSACSSTAGSSSAVVSRSPFCAQLPGATCLSIVHSRFTVAIGSQVQAAARAVGVSIDSVVTGALERIDRILPGVPTQIEIALGTQVIPELGVNGYTSPSNGQIAIIVDPTSQIPFAKTLRTWLPEALSHEVNHSVRILGGPGFGASLAETLVTEGLATAFDSQASPGFVEPWMNALTPTEEASLWERMQGSLNTTGVAVYDQWFFGSAGIPRWTGFTIGYHIVADYLRRHPQSTAGSIVHLSATTILSGSKYSP